MPDPEGFRIPKSPEHQPAIAEALEAEGLTAKQAQVVAWVLLGYTIAETAKLIGRNVSAVKNRLSNAYHSHGGRTRTGLIIRFGPLVVRITGQNPPPKPTETPDNAVLSSGAR